MPQTVSIKRNIFYSSILTISGYLFPLLTFPYVTRVLGVANLGVCNFVDSIVQYFILFSMMGIGTTAIREVAKVKDNKEKLSLAFSSLLTLNMIATFIAIGVLILCTLIIPDLARHNEMLYIGIAKILFNSLLIEWFYKGLEDFKYITVRTIIVRFLYVIAVFLLVRNSEDYIIYFTLNVIMVVLNALVNLVHSRKFATFSFKKICIRPYVFSFFTLGLYCLLTSMYTSFNVAYLGFVCGEVEVGYYTISSKLFSLILAFFTAFTGVMLPRMSSLISEGKTEEFKTLANKSIEALLVFVLPLIIVCIVYAPTIIRFIAGEGYEGSILPMKIIMPLMLIIGYEQIIIIQILMPLKKDKAILINSFVGALVALSANIFLVSTYKSVGSAIVWIVSECTVMLSAQYFVNKYIAFKFPFLQIIKRLIITIPILIICLCTYNDSLIHLILALIATYLVYFIYEYFVIKGELTRNYVNIITKNISKK